MLMQNHEPYIIVTNEAQLEAVILKIHKRCVENNIIQQKTQEENNQLLTRDETAKFLSINLVTLWKLTRDGVVKSYSFQNSSRIYYKKSELLEALKRVK